jgi:hypothetical protein
VALVGGAVFAVGLAGFGVVAGVSRARAPVAAFRAAVPRADWTMPPLALLSRPEWSPGRKIAMLALRGYLLVSMLLLIVKAVQLGGG